MNHHPVGLDEGQPAPLHGRQLGDPQERVLAGDGAVAGGGAGGGQDRLPHGRGHPVQVPQEVGGGRGHPHRGVGGVQGDVQPYVLELVLGCQVLAQGRAGGGADGDEHVALVGQGVGHVGGLVGGAVVGGEAGAAGAGQEPTCGAAGAGVWGVGVHGHEVRLPPEPVLDQGGAPVRWPWPPPRPGEPQDSAPRARTPRRALPQDPGALLPRVYRWWTAARG